MIQRIYEIPDRFRIDNCVIGRIDGYFRAYGSDYDFCRFYSGENSLIMNYDGEHFVYTDENCDKDELMFFLMADGLNCATVNENAYKLMKDDLSGFACQKLYLMTKENINASQAAKEVAVTDNYCEVYEVLKSAFGLGAGDYDRWYTDTCHRVRHNVSRLYKLKSDGDTAAVCTVLYENGYGCFLSHIGVKSGRQGKGLGKMLICGVADSLSGKRVSLLCKEDKVDFYKKCGFTCAGNEYQIIKEKRI